MSDAREIVSVVPVRGGSKGLPDKNTRCLGGLPLYLRAALQGERTVGRCIITTDIDEILSATMPSNTSVIRRSEQLAEDDTLMAPVLFDLIERCELQSATIVLLQATSPLRLDSDINAALDMFSTSQFDLVMSVSRKDSEVLKYGTLEDGRYAPFRDPQFCFANRQNLPPVYSSNGAVYVFSAQAFLESRGFPASSIGALEMPEERSFDIDTLEDFLRAEAAFRDRNAD